jgi:hypothetical protein
MIKDLLEAKRKAAFKRRYENQLDKTTLALLLLLAGLLVIAAVSTFNFLAVIY